MGRGVPKSGLLVRDWSSGGKWSYRGERGGYTGGYCAVSTVLEITGDGAWAILSLHHCPFVHSRPRLYGCEEKAKGRRCALRGHHASNKVLVALLDRVRNVRSQRQNCVWVSYGGGGGGLCPLIFATFKRKPSRQEAMVSTSISSSFVVIFFFVHFNQTTTKNSFKKILDARSMD